MCKAWCEGVSSTLVNLLAEALKVSRLGKGPRRDNGATKRRLSLFVVDFPFFNNNKKQKAKSKKNPRKIDCYFSLNFDDEGSIGKVSARYPTVEPVSKKK